MEPVAMQDLLLPVTPETLLRAAEMVGGFVAVVVCELLPLAELFLVVLLFSAAPKPTVASTAAVARAERTAAVRARFMWGEPPCRKPVAEKRARDSFRNSETRDAPAAAQ